MSKETERSTDLAVQADPFDVLTARLKRLQLLLLVLAIICLIGVTSGLTALGLLMAAGGEDETPVLALIEKTQHMEEQILLLSSQADTLLARTEQTSTALTALSSQVSEIDVKDQNNVVIRLQRILIRQEQDYRNFLTSLENGLYNFHMMIPHSRGWWDDYRQELVESAELSKARENYVVNLRNN